MKDRFENYFVEVTISSHPEIVCLELKIGKSNENKHPELWEPVSICGEAAQWNDWRWGYERDRTPQWVRK